MANFIQMAQKAAQFKSKMQQLQERVREVEVEGSVNGVTCRMNGAFVLTALETGDGKAADIMAAVNDARDKAERLMAEETKKLMDDLGLPPGLGLPF